MSAGAARAIAGRPRGVHARRRSRRGRASSSLLVPLAVDASAALLAPIEHRPREPGSSAPRGGIERVRPQIVAITGSYGKTSTKHHLAELLWLARRLSSRRPGASTTARGSPGRSTRTSSTARGSSSPRWAPTAPARSARCARGAHPTSPSSPRSDRCTSSGSAPSSGSSRRRPRSPSAPDRSCATSTTSGWRPLADGLRADRRARSCTAGSARRSADVASRSPRDRWRVVVRR